MILKSDYSNLSIGTNRIQENGLILAILKLIH